MNWYLNTQKFWNSVANDYSNSTMTSHQNDFELNIIKDNLNNISQLEGIVSLGCANGIRDPIFILENCEIKNLSEVTCLDISEKMIDECKENLKKYNFSKKFIVNKISDLTEFNKDLLKESIFICGVYNANYIVQSLEIYKNNIDKIGNYFTITPVIYKYDKLLERTDLSLKFNIVDYSYCSEKILNMQKLDCFYAYNIKTEKEFVSHFFDSAKLYSLLNTIFPHKIEVIKDEKYPRYLIFKIINGELNNCNYIITMLNNVLGNILTNEQVLSLQNINKLFFK